MPYATENHQEYNAKVLVNVGAARIILEKDLNEEILSSQIEELIKDKERLKEMGQNARKIETKDVEKKIYQEIKNLMTCRIRS